MTNACSANKVLRTAFRHSNCSSVPIVPGGGGTSTERIVVYSRQRQYLLKDPQKWLAFWEIRCLVIQLSAVFKSAGQRACLLLYSQNQIELDGCILPCKTAKHPRSGSAKTVWAVLCQLNRTLMSSEINQLHALAAIFPPPLQMARPDVYGHPILHQRM